MKNHKLVNFGQFNVTDDELFKYHSDISILNILLFLHVVLSIQSW